MPRTSDILSERIYWIILAVGLCAFLSILWLLLVPYNIIGHDLGINLTSESFGILFTIIFLTWLFRLREKIQKRPVEKKFKQRLSNLMLDIFLKLQVLLDPRQWDGPGSIQDLKKIANLEKIRFNILEEERLTSSKKTIKKWNLHEPEVYNALREVKHELWAMRTEYSDILDSSLANLRVSLTDIEQWLDSLTGWFKLREVYFGIFGEEDFLNLMRDLVHQIIRKIYWMYEARLIDWE